MNLQQSVKTRSLWLVDGMKVQQLDGVECPDSPGNFYFAALGRYRRFGEGAFAERHEAEQVFGLLLNAWRL